MQSSSYSYQQARRHRYDQEANQGHSAYNFQKTITS